MLDARPADKRGNPPPGHRAPERLFARRLRAPRASTTARRRRTMRSESESQDLSTGATPATAARRAGAERMKIRVVVAEDHPLVREGVIRALERDPGIEVIGEADNGITAMELARQLKPDVMVLDLRMPG